MIVLLVYSVFCLYLSRNQALRPYFGGGNRGISTYAHWLTFEFVGQVEIHDMCTVDVSLGSKLRHLSEEKVLFMSEEEFIDMIYPPTTLIL